MLGALGRAMAEHRHTWLQHYGWFTDLVIELQEEEPGKPLEAERRLRRGSYATTGWWLDATTRLFNDEPAVPLDG
jgi:cell division inhibitor SulA